VSGLLRPLGGRERCTDIVVPSLCYPACAASALFLPPHWERVRGVRPLRDVAVVVLKPHIPRGKVIVALPALRQVQRLAASLQGEVSENLRGKKSNVCVVCVCV
jgi:hypothetical protein